MKAVRLLLVTVAVVFVVSLGAYIRRQQSTIRQQRTEGFAISGNPATAPVFSQKVLAVGALFLTYDSSEKDSALWVVHPAAMFSPYSAESLVQWKDPGRVVWSRSGRDNADLLIEFAPQTNHRIAIIRVKCTEKSCRTTSQERGLPPDLALYVNDDDAVLLAGESSFTIYSSIADFINSKGDAIPRMSARTGDELAATSRDTTLILSNPRAWSGELVDGGSHTRVQLKSETGDTPSALAVSGGLQLVADGGGHTRLWDCPASVLKGSGVCSVYTAPAGFPLAGLTSLTDDECGIAIHRDGAVWVVRRNARTESIVAASGIARCNAGEIVVYRDRRIQFLIFTSQAVSAERRTMSATALR